MQTGIFIKTTNWKCVRVSEHARFDPGPMPAM
jgi:hypothetical protein